MSNITGGITRGLGSGLGFAASHAIINKLHEHHEKHKREKAKEEAREEKKKREEKEAKEKKSHSQSTPGNIQNQPASAPHVEELQKQHAAYYTAPSLPNAIPPARPPPALHAHAVCIRDFTGHTATETSMSSGDRLTILHSDPSGWTEVTVDRTGATGWVPEKFLHHIEDDALSQARASAANSANSWKK